jgi:hypothetical protein
MGDNNASSARILMQAGGETCKVTGLSLSTVSTLYAMKYLTIAGTSLVEYLPHLFNPDNNVTFREHMSVGNTAGWYAVAMTCGILLSGVVIRKIGTFASSDSTITGMERFLYGTRPVVADDNHNN